MKKFFFSVAAVAAALTFTACSSEDVISSSENAVPQWNENGVGYMALSVSMPKDVATRANDNFDKGEIAEYEVKDGLCLIFNGSTKHFSQAFPIDTNFGNGKDGNVTTDNLMVKQVKAVEDPQVLVVLNTNGLVTVTNETVGGVTTQVLRVNGVVCEGMTQFQAQITDVDKYKENGFLMLNAPLWSKPGTEVGDPAGGKMTVFADANKAIYASETEARAHAQGVTEVFVERALAKVTLNAPTAKTEVTNGFDWQVNNWVLDNTNTTSYLLRETNNLTNDNIYRLSYNAESKGYRMVGSQTVMHQNPVTNGSGVANDNYRTYFGRSTNYAGTETLSTAATFDWDHANAVNSNDYCAENVFEVAHMNYKNTTRVVLKTTLTPVDGESLYAKAGDPAFYKEADVKKMAYNKVLAGVTTEAEKTAIKNSLLAAGNDKDITTVQYADANVTITDGADEIVVALGDSWSKKVSSSDLGLSYYKGGVAYYDVRIKHFGDEYTPWNAEAHTEANTILQSYGEDNKIRENAYLGRWGVLRNNWYVLEVTDVKKVGYATTNEIKLEGEYGDTPDDNKKTEQWIAVDVNILSWAKRFQPVEL